MTLLSPDEIAPVKRDLDRTLAALDSMLLGRPALHRLVIAGILARGHILSPRSPRYSSSTQSAYSSRQT